MAEIPQDVRTLAAGIADDIERNGHYQGQGEHYWPGPFLSGGPDAPCCLWLSPTAWRISEHDQSSELWRKLTELIGIAPVSSEDLDIEVHDGPAFDDWNDKTPTAEVLGTLRKIAAGERP
jgi:hypothetical protein